MAPKLWLQKTPEVLQLLEPLLKHLGRGPDCAGGIDVAVVLLAVDTIRYTENCFAEECCMFFGLIIFIYEHLNKSTVFCLLLMHSKSNLSANKLDPADTNEALSWNIRTSSLPAKPPESQAAKAGS